MKDLTKLKGYRIISEFLNLLERSVKKESLEDFLALSVRNMLLILGVIATTEQERLIEIYVPYI